MVNLAGITCVIVAVLSAPGDDGPVSIRMVAVKATQEGHREKQFDAQCREIRDAVKDLPFDTYRHIKSGNLSAPLGRETKVVLDGKYTLYLTPLSREESGHVKVKLRVMLAPKDPKRDKPAKVIEATVAATPGKEFKFRGLKLEPGEMVVVLKVNQ